MSPVRICAVCSIGEGTDIKIQRCSRCQQRFYCGVLCQTADWATHKTTCVKPSIWYDKHRKCRDGSYHEGQLELITWSCAAEDTGWGACLADESDDLRKKFETDYGRDESILFAHWPQGFRWTCCGTDAGMDWGCDHHGTGSKPCTCDFCRMGKPLPDSIFDKESAARRGLELRRGPDPRSFHAGIAGIAATSRTMMGLEM